MRDQRRNILRALTKRRDVHRENVQPVVQITAESPGAHILRQIPIRQAAMLVDRREDEIFEERPTRGSPPFFTASCIGRAVTLI